MRGWGEEGGECGGKHSDAQVESMRDMHALRGGMLVHHVTDLALCHGRQLATRIVHLRQSQQRVNHPGRRHNACNHSQAWRGSRRRTMVLGGHGARDACAWERGRSVERIDRRTHRLLFLFACTMLNAGVAV